MVEQSTREALRLPETLERAVRYFQGGQLAEAEHLCRLILADAGERFDALHILGAIKLRQRHFQEAVNLISLALRLSPTSAEAWSHLGFGLTQLGHYREALDICDRAVSLDSNLAGAWVHRGLAVGKLGRHEEAVGNFDRALLITPGHVEALNNRGNALLKLDREQEAIASFDDALMIDPGHANALNNRGNALDRIGRHEEALASYRRAGTVKADYAEAWHNHGLTLATLGRFDQALASYGGALAIRPDYADAFHSRGVAFSNSERFEDALCSYDCALGLNANWADAWHNRGLVLERLHRHREAVDSYRRALAIDPGHPYAFGALAYCELLTCNWTETEGLEQELLRHVAEGKSNIVPFTLLCYGAEPSKQLLCARRFARRLGAAQSQRAFRPAVRRDARIRVAYVSADFYRHATALLIAQLFELHDRSRFEIIGVSFGPDDGSEMRLRIKNSFDKFHEVGGMSDREVAELMRDLEIGIAVDLKGYTTGSRAGIFTHRPAPIQVSYLGYPGTTGSPFIDYIIADTIVLPLDQQQFFTEKIVHLPGCYQVNDSTRKISPRLPIRSKAGLPKEGIVLCCFNNNYKIRQEVFDIWMRLLHRVERGVLWLLECNEVARQNLCCEADRRGIDPARLIFAQRMESEDHLARQCLADLFLDTVPVNAHTTASDALWAGLPVLTCKGNSFAGRVAASLLHAVGLPDLVTDSLEEYELAALKLATDRSLRQSIRRRLQENRANCSLFDTDRFRRQIEAAYEQMWELWRSGEEPRSFTVVPS